MLAGVLHDALFQEAGLPDGVMNLVYGSGKDIGDPALASLELAGVHFTGSTAVFQSMWKTIGQNIAGYRSYPRIVGETGGKDFIVAHPTADAEAVATAILRGSFEYQGQKCSAASRVYAPASMWPAIQEQLVDQVGEIKYGDVSDFSNFMGAVIDAASFDTQKEAIEEAKADAKSEVVVGGGYDDSEGYFVEPTVIRTEDPDFRLLKDELFGPVVTTFVYPDGSWEETLELIDRTAPYALTGPSSPASEADGSVGRPAGYAEPLRQRQADRRRRRAAAVRRSGVRDERQGGLAMEPDPLGEPADDQGDLRPAEGLPLSVHPGRGLAFRISRAGRSPTSSRSPRRGAGRPS